MPHNETGDLQWIAFQYVSDELPAEEAAQFEERLAVDQAAREAVADAMLLLQAVAAGAKIIAPVSRQRSWLQGAGWAAVGAAACLAIVVTIRSLPMGAALSPQARVADPSSAELALVWAQNSSFTATTFEEHSDEELGITGDSGDVVVPLWMLEALSNPEEIKPASKESRES